MVKRMFAALGYDGMPDYVLHAWTNKLARVGPRLAHARATGLPGSASDELDEYFRVFEGTLQTLSQRTFEHMDDLDEILDQANN